MAKSTKSGHISKIAFDGFKDALLAYGYCGKVLRTDADMTNGFHTEKKGGKK